MLRDDKLNEWINWNRIGGNGDGEEEEEKEKDMKIVADTQLAPMKAITSPKWGIPMARPVCNASKRPLERALHASSDLRSLIFNESSNWIDRAGGEKKRTRVSENDIDNRYDRYVYSNILTQRLTGLSTMGMVTQMWRVIAIVAKSVTIPNIMQESNTTTTTSGLI